MTSTTTTPRPVQEAVDMLRGYATVRVAGAVFANEIRSAAERQGLKVFVEHVPPQLFSLTRDDDKHIGAQAGRTR